MQEALLEIVELESGEVVLRRSDTSQGSSEAFVSIKFSEEAKGLVNHQTGNLARFMISVGLQMVAKIHAEALHEAMTTDDEHSANSEDGIEDVDHDVMPAHSRLH